MVNDGPGIRNQPRHGTANMSIELNNLFNRRGLHERRRDSLLDGKDNTMGSLDSNCRRPHLQASNTELPLTL